MADPFLYDVFISYSHSDSGPIAKELQRGLEKIGKQYIFFSKPALRVFRDETNLSASPDLWFTIQTALESSRYFILIASPMSSQSVWVNRELAWWMEHRAHADLFIAVANGVISWDEMEQCFSSTSNCLSPIIISSFRREPHWLDLRNFNDDNGKLSYKETQFKTPVIKLIAAITGKAPRDIDSEDRRIVKRNRNIGIGIAFTLLTLAFISIFFWYQGRLTRRISLANKFIAEANRLKISNPTKALGYFVEGYAAYSDTTNFSLLTEFYNSRTLLLPFKKNPPDTMSVFAKTVWQPALMEPDEDLDEDELPYISQQHKLAVLLMGDSIVRINLSKKTRDTVKLKDVNLHSAAYNDLSGKLYLLHINMGSEFDMKVLRYDVRSGLMDTLIYSVGLKLKFRETLISTPFHPQCLYKMSFSDNGNYLLLTNIFFDSNCHPLDNSYILNQRYYKYALILNLETGEVKNAGIFKGDQRMNNIQVSNDGKSVYSFWEGYGSSSTKLHLVSSTDTLTDHILFQGDNHSSILPNQPTCFKWFGDGKGYMMGGMNGTVYLNFGDHYDPEEMITDNITLMTSTLGDAISCLEVSQNFIIAGTVSGKVILWKNYYPEVAAMIVMRQGYPLVRVIQLPANTGLKEIKIDSGETQLLALDYHGGIYQVDLKKHLTLSSNVSRLRKQIKELDIDTVLVNTAPGR